MKVTNCHTFTNEEENIIRAALLSRAWAFEDENGETNHLSRQDKEYYDKVMALYREF